MIPIQFNHITSQAIEESSSQTEAEILPYQAKSTANNNPAIFMHLPLRPSTGRPVSLHKNILNRRNSMPNIGSTINHEINIYYKKSVETEDISQDTHPKNNRPERISLPDSVIAQGEIKKDLSIPQSHEEKWRGNPQLLPTINREYYGDYALDLDKKLMKLKNSNSEFDSDSKIIEDYTYSGVLIKEIISELNNKESSSETYDAKSTIRKMIKDFPKSFNHDGTWSGQKIVDTFKADKSKKVSAFISEILEKMIESGLGTDNKFFIYRFQADHTLINEGDIVSSPAPSSCSFDTDLSYLLTSENSLNEKSNTIPIVRHIIKVQAADISKISGLMGEKEILMKPGEQTKIIFKGYDAKLKIYRSVEVGLSD